MQGCVCWRTSRRVFPGSLLPAWPPHRPSASSGRRDPHRTQRTPTPHSPSCSLSVNRVLTALRRPRGAGRGGHSTGQVPPQANAHPPHLRLVDTRTPDVDAAGLGGSEAAHFQHAPGEADHPGPRVWTSGRSGAVVGRDSGSVPWKATQPDPELPVRARSSGTARPPGPLRSWVPAPSSSGLPSCAEAHGRLLIGGPGSRGGGCLAAREAGKAARGFHPSW